MDINYITLKPRQRQGLEQNDPKMATFRKVSGFGRLRGFCG